MVLAYDFPWARMSAGGAVPITFTSIEQVTHEDDRRREAHFWAQRTMAERVIAGWALADSNLTTPLNNEQSDQEPEKRAGFTLRRVPRSGR